ncbi:MAG: hypothetical protein FJ100_22875 [Deltaproteobacteria bacterium]|nr:hypothetical protein [Deltaproteobacteria bacterium]
MSDRRVRRIAWTLGLAALAVPVSMACEPTLACDTSAAAGLVITVTQGLNGPVLCDAEVTVSDGATTEKVSAQGSPCVYTAAYEKPGTYTVVAAKAGLKSATKTGIVVDNGECHVETQQVTLVLEL